MDNNNGPQIFRIKFLFSFDLEFPALNEECVLKLSIHSQLFELELIGYPLVLLSH